MSPGCNTSREGDDMVGSTPIFRAWYVSMKYVLSTPPSNTMRGTVAIPSPSKYREPKALGSCGSSRRVSSVEATLLPSPSSRKEFLCCSAEPCKALSIGLSRRSAFRLSTTMVYCPLATLRCPSLRTTRSRALAPMPDLRRLSWKRAISDQLSAGRASPSSFMTTDAERENHVLLASPSKPLLMRR